jgi:hypothetical protein
MNKELQLGKYEFFPNEDYWEKIFKELKQSEMTAEEQKKHLEDILKLFQKRKRKRKRKQI